MSDDPSPDDSQVKAFGQSVSLRGLIAAFCVIALCVNSAMHPELYSPSFKEMVTAVIFFYFGSVTRK